MTHHLCDTCTLRDQGCVIDPLGVVSNCTVYRKKETTLPQSPAQTMAHSSSTETLVKAMRVLARDINSEDGVANAAIAEAADRLEAQAARIKDLERRVIDLDQKLHGRPGRL